MGLGTEMKVNLGEYLKVVGQVWKRDECSELAETLKAKYGAAGNVSFYQGEKGDGSIVMMSYGNDGGLKSALRFSDDGKVYDLSSNKDLFEINKNLAFYFIAGLYGTDEISWNSIESAKVWAKGITESRGCYDLDSSTECDSGAIERAGHAVRGEAQREVEAITVLFADMIAWAIRNDGGPGGIDPDDITDKIKPYESVLSLMSDPVKKRETLREILIKIRNTMTGDDFLREKKLLLTEKLDSSSGCSGTYRNRYTITIPTNSAGVNFKLTWIYEGSFDHCKPTRDYSR